LSDILSDKPANLANSAKPQELTAFEMWVFIVSIGLRRTTNNSYVTIQNSSGGGLAQWWPEVTIHRARLVLEWVTVSGRINHLGLSPAT